MLPQLGLAAAALTLGAVLSLSLRTNRARAAAAIATQAAATLLVEIAVAPLLFGAPEARRLLEWSYPTSSLALHVDALGAFFLAWSLPATLLGTLYAVGYLRPFFAARNAGVQFALLNVTSLSFILIYTVESASVFLLAWELAAVAAWLAVIWDYRNQKIRFAGFNYLVSTHLGFFFLVAAFMVMHSQTASMDFEHFAGFLSSPSSLRNVTFVLLVTSFSLKSAFFPFHTWLPRAHSAAPAHVSALMSGVIHKAGLFGLLRFILLIGTPEPWMGWYILGLSALSAVMGALYTTTQRDLKRLLGYSSTENVGIAGIGIGVGCLGLSWNQPALVALGFTGGILHIVNHALFKCLLFYAAGAIYRRTHTIDLERLGGLAKKMPLTAALFLCGGLAISGLPPLNGFVSELLIYAGLLGHAAPTGPENAALICTAALLAFVGGVSALAMTRAFGLAFLGLPRDASVHCDGEVEGSMLAPMAVHAGLVVVFGAFPFVALKFVAEPVRLFAGSVDAGALAPSGGVLNAVVVSAALLAGILAALALARWALGRRRRPVAHVTWACGYTGVSPRMQYTGTSFSHSFARLFEAVLVQLRREAPPEGAFPQKHASLSTHTVDAVERRMFEVLGEGEQLAKRLMGRLSEEPGASFALGLLALVVLMGLLVMGGGHP